MECTVSSNTKHAINDQSDTEKYIFVVGFIKYTVGCINVRISWTFWPFATLHPQTNKKIFGFLCERPMQSGKQTWSEKRLTD